MTLAKYAAALAVAAFAMSAPAQAGHGASGGQSGAEKKDDTGKKAGNIVSQPVRDVGLSKTEIPPVLVAASENPYSLQGAKTCPQIASKLQRLNAALGADFTVGAGANEKRSSALEVGGRAVVNSLIPFRGIVREVSGAAPAERRLNAAVDAGIAQRGFLRGLQSARGCRR